MKKVLSIVLALCFMVALFAGCGGQEAVELTIFAAASMTETLTKLGEQYMAGHEDVTLIFNFDSSGTLKTQIEEGAEADIFISAGQKQMDQLDCVLTDSRLDLLENKVALAVPEGNPADVRSFDALAEALQNGSVLLAMGNADVPVGQYTQKILAYYGLDEEALANAGCLTYGSNAKEVTTQVAEAVVDCGIIYQTDAFSAGLTIVDTANAEMCGQVIYPAAVLSGSRYPAEAQEFLAFLTFDSADAIFEEVGFTPIA